MTVVSFPSRLDVTRSPEDVFGGYLVSRRREDPDGAVSRAIGERLDYLVELAATSSAVRRSRRSYAVAIDAFTSRRDELRRTALAAEIRDLRRALRKERLP